MLPHATITVVGYGYSEIRWEGLVGGKTETGHVIMWYTLSGHKYGTVVPHRNNESVV